MIVRQWKKWQNKNWSLMNKIIKNLNRLQCNQRQVLFLARKVLPELVCDVVNLEGINYTLPEVMTLLDGVTVGGKKQQDELIANNQIKAWKLLFELVEGGAFRVDKKTVCILHEAVAKEEALTYGKFRNGGVFITGTDYLPPQAVLLDEIWQQGVPTLKNNTNAGIYQCAISLFLQMARNQFFFDGNKRTGRLVMNGVLLSHGLPVINLPAKRQLEFNQLMLDFYISNNEKPMQDFMLSCLDEKIITIMTEVS